MQHYTLLFYEEHRATRNHPVRKQKKCQAVQQKQKQLRFDEMVDVIISSYEADFYWSRKIIHLVNIN